MPDWSQYITELTPVQREFLAVIRAAFNDKPLETPPEDWPGVLEMARLHHVDSWLYSKVQHWPSTLQPDAPLMARWRHNFLLRAVQYTRIAEQARELLAALSKANIPVIPLKGIYLAETLYEDGACRPMNDIDLLVPMEELEKAREAIETLGYETSSPSKPDSSFQSMHCTRTRAPIFLELHARKTPEHIWEGLNDTHLYNVPVKVPYPERQLVYLAQHVLKHKLRAPLKSYLDLALLVDKDAENLDSKTLNRELNAWHTVFSAAFVLTVACDIFNLPAPRRSKLSIASEGASKEARETTIHTTLQQNTENIKYKNLFDDFCRSSRWRRLSIGISRFLIAPSLIRSAYPNAVKRFGLLGGYVCRSRDLLRRYSRSLRIVGKKRAVSEDLTNFQARRALSNWLHRQDEHELSGRFE
jgi:hypothetical protein